MRKFEAIRTEIKKLSQEQRYYKPLRKPSNAYSIEKTAGVTPYGAEMIVVENKYELRHLFQTYAILKGVERPEVKKASNYNGWVLDQNKIDEMVKKFKPAKEEGVHTLV